MERWNGNGENSEEMCVERMKKSFLVFAGSLAAAAAAEISDHCAAGVDERIVFSRRLIKQLTEQRN